MDVFRTIAAQIEAMHLPLFAVTLTALPRRQTPLLLMLHWHAFRSAPEEAPSPPHRLQPVPTSGLQINEDWLTLQELDQSMLDAAWQLGAWELARETLPGCNRAGAPVREAHACRQAFGDDPLDDLGRTPMVSDAPDREDMMRLGAEVGYLRWAFRPVRGGIWQQTAQDDTLDAAGGRLPPCPVKPVPPSAPGKAPSRYRLGRIDRLIVVT